MISNVIELCKLESYTKLFSSNHFAHFLSLSKQCPKFHGISMFKRKFIQLKNHSNLFLFYLFFKKILFIYLFIFGCVGSSFLCEGFFL